MNKIVLLISLACLVQQSHSQPSLNLKEPLGPFMSPTVIQTHKIKSLIVFAELSEDGTIGEDVISGKTLEMEFNSSGNLIYRITSDNGGNGNFIYYGRGSFIVLNTYDDANNLVLVYSENEHQFRKELMTYNSAGNLTSMQFIISQDTLYKIEFEWMQGKMYKSEIVSRSELNKSMILQYDELGRIIQSRNSKRSNKWQYEQKGDTLITTLIVYKSDTLSHTEKYETMLKFNRVISYILTDHSGKVVSEMKAAFDDKGNATYYYLDSDKRYPPYTYTIQNYYDTRNLLTKRKFYYSREDVGNNLVVKIERYIWDVDPLSFKMKEGSLQEAEPTYEGACDSGDE